MPNRNCLILSADISVRNNLLFKTEHPLRKLFVHFLSRIRIAGIGMMTVVEFYDVKAAAVYIKRDISSFEIWWV